MTYLEQVQDLNARHAPSGNELDLGKHLLTLVQPYADEAYIDTLGNVIVHKKGRGKKLLLSAHMDSIGLIVTHIEDNGFLRLGKLGGVSAFSYHHTPFSFQNGTNGILVLGESVKEKDMSLDEMFLDIGAKDKAEAESKVSLGDTAVCALPSFAMGSRLTSPYLDNRISCVILLELLRHLHSVPSYDLYLVFSVQEEVGLRGAKTATFGILPDYALAVDVTSGDEPNPKHKDTCTLGKGTAIKVMDASVICHPQWVGQLKTLAEERGILHQMDVSTAGGTDAGVMHTTASGVITGGLSIPCRYIHSGVETVDTADVDATLSLLLALLHAEAV